MSGDSAPAAEAALLPALFAAEERHWWAAGMRRVSHALLDGIDLPAGWIVDVGCGAGAWAAELARRYPQRRVLALDRHGAALAAASRRAARTPGLHVVAADGHRLPAPASSCALAAALDVLDQAGIDPGRAVAEMARVLCPGGWLLLRVSAYPWLLGPHDRAFGTGRRYSRGALETLLAGAGFGLIRLTYANALLLPPAAAARLAQRRGWLPAPAGLAAPLGLNRLLTAALGWEARWLRGRDLPWGLSLCALAINARSMT